MAEFGDALSTAITSQNVGYPSIFEVFAQDNLNNSIRPALKHIVKGESSGFKTVTTLLRRCGLRLLEQQGFCITVAQVLAQHSPHKFAWYYQWYNELYTLLEYVLQHHFLRNNRASFAEYYYDMERKSVNPTTANPNYPLGKGLHFLSLVTLTLFPYFQLKLENLYSTIKEQCSLKGLQSLSSTQLMIYHCYPLIHLLWNAAVLYHNFMYAIDRSEFFSPIYRALNMKLVSVNPFEVHSERNGSFSKMLTNFLTGSVHVGVFAIQFIEWWYDENKENSVKTALKQPAPGPPTRLSDESLISVPQDGICPLCNRHRKNDTALMTSGYVFCYACIYKYVKSHHRCPVTGYATESNHLIKIYPPT